MSQTSITETAQMTHARQLGNKDVGNSTIHHAEAITAINHVAVTEEEITSMADQQDHPTEHEKAAVESEADQEAENVQLNNVKIVV